MKCPKCNADLVPAVRHKINVNYCQSCKGMWLEHQDLGKLEDEVFDYGDDAKGTLAFSSTPTTAKCPECNAPLKRFKYRFYDLEMEVCENQHGYWLDEDEDTRVLQLMKKEEADETRKLLAENQWTKTLKHLRSGSFLSKVRDLFH
ncbi:MAG TPA: zf-TFIIB domain-containing protein [Gammaproteobacteria bacterium]|nr:zf-TFIIB domain-containing protein [Gammaproteobacteria bacterium]